MHFVASHTFRVPSPEALAELYFDEPFNEALCANGRLRRELLSLRRESNVLLREVRVEPERTLPAPAARWLGSERFGYVEHMAFDFAALHGTWRIEPALLGEKISSSGTLSFAAAPDGAQRKVEGEFQVKVFGLGKTIERFVVGDVEKSYDEAAAFTARYLLEYPLTRS